MQVDDEFVEAVRKEYGINAGDRGIIAATLAVAAERGMVVPEGAAKMWASKEGKYFRDFYRTVGEAKMAEKVFCETVVRVAVVEIKE